MNIPTIVGRLITELDKVVIGYGDIKRFSIAALLSDNHVLLEGLPGTAKSLFVDAFQCAISDSASVRTQMTPDVKPMDLIGVRIYNPGANSFEIEQGPLCGKNFVLVDEINRAPGKTLSALLSAMQERRVYIAGHEISLPDPYFVMATQNPIEQEGVYPLPEAQIDRFAMKLIVPYASFDDEMGILSTSALDERDPQSVIEQVVSVKEVLELRQRIKSEVHVSDAAKRYIVSLVRATRPALEEHEAVCKKAPALADMIKVGCSARAELALRSLGRVVAAIKGRSYVLPEDVQELAMPVLRHRTLLSFEAEAEGASADDALKYLVEHVPFHQDLGDYAPKAA